MIGRILRRARKVGYRLRCGRPGAPEEGLRWTADGRFLFESGGKDELVECYRKYFGGGNAGEKEEADRILKHDFRFLSHDYGLREKPINWHLDPVSGMSWPRVFFDDIPFKGSGRLGDIKFPWELAKHQYFFSLGKAYWLTGDEAYALEYRDTVLSWIRDNPPYQGIHWISGLEMGMRVLSWITARYFMEGSPAVDGGFEKTMLDSLYAQSRHIYENLTEKKWANNHLIGEATALLFTGLLVDSKMGGRFRKKGIAILEDQIDNQFFEDGVGREQSLNYHRLTLDFYLLAQALMARNGLSLSDHAMKRLEEITEALMFLIKPGQGENYFGDGDDSRGICVGAGCHEDYRSLLAIGAVLFGRADFRSRAGGPCEELLWLLGKEAVEEFEKMAPADPAETSRGFPRGGYYVMRGGWDPNDGYLLFDCGPLGLGSGGHGHADALSFQLSARGFNYLVDPGTYSYNMDYRWRDYFRSTPAHNTVTVDGLDQSEMLDRMSWKTQAHSKCNLWLTTRWFDFVDGEHDGYMRLDDPVSHRRMIFSDRNNYWVIIDLMKCEAGHVFDQYLHLHPDCGLLPDEDGHGFRLVSGADDVIRVSIRDVDDTLPEMKVSRGDKDTGPGWYSGSYGSRVPAGAIRVRRRSKGDTLHATVIDASGVNRLFSFSAARGGMISLTVRDPSIEGLERIWYSLGPGGEETSADLLFRGRLCYMKERPGAPPEAFAVEAREFELKGRIGIHSGKVIKEIAVLGDEVKVSVSGEAAEGLRISNAGGYRVIINGSGKIREA